MKKGLVVVLIVFAALMLMMSVAFAKNSYLNDVNGTCGTSYGCGLCHIDPKGGGPLTTDGEDYVASGYDACYFCASSCGGPTCTDNDGDTYAVEGGDCGPVDCNDNDASINPGAEEDCTDGIDNDCDDLVDAADPDAVNCPPTCTDNDADLYSVEGGTCGAADCNDNDAAVNPGAVENCTNVVDDDCDNKTDCDDTDCVGDPACPQSQPEICDDGIDNDLDGKTDCSDKADCRKDPACTDGGGGPGGGDPEICDDGIDNDGDGKTDCADKKDCGKDPAC